MKNTVLLFLFMLIILVVCSLCKHDSTGMDNLPEVCFENQVLPIFQANCAMSGCHGASSAEGYDFRTYNGIMQAVSPGNPEKSDVYKAITNKWGTIMPPKGNNQLTKDQRTIIYVWIKQGANKTTCPSDSIAQLPDTICYKEKIHPILMTSCAISGCHNQTTAQSGVILSDYNNLMSTSPLQLVVPNNAAASRVYQVVNTTMPPSYKEPLTTLQKQELLTWINYGAKNNSCGTQVDYPTDTIIPVNDSVCFEQKILPILASSCAMSGCHNQASAQGGIVLTSYSGLMASYEEVLVIPGNAASSKIIKVVKGINEDIMPPSPQLPLTTAQIDLFTTWINDGALNSSCESGCDTNAVTFSFIVNPIIQNNCLGCHSGSSPSGGVNLSGYTNVNTVAVNGKLLGVVKKQSGYPLMPPSGSLSDCSIRQIELWVQDGAQNNKK